MLTERGAFGNLPCGEGFIPPAGGNGTLVIDGSLAGVGLADEPVELVVEGGHLTSARGGQGMAFMDLLTEHGDDGTNLAELGIGTNEKAILTGNILEDEKILGTAHVAFGASAAIGGNVQVPVHLDCVVMKPTVTLDGEPLVAGRRAARHLTMLLSAPNFSEGRSERIVDAIGLTLGSHARLLNTHFDPRPQPQRLHALRASRASSRPRCSPARSTRSS